MAINAYSERFLQVIDKLGVTDYFVWNNCDSISKAQMSHIRTGKGGASLSIIEAFCNQFPQVNANYILTGKGSMFLDNETSHSSLSEKDVEDLPSAETVEYWRRMYKSTVDMYEVQLENLQKHFDELNKSVENIQSFFNERKKAI
ncbi:hypothetical protein [Bacteroides clarus]|uniref:hypothetical protein n=1 Tax=Bacteroides clarus TaxID=626929 RepID=UPI002676C3A1|nr:hypothetical protein [Bacteroides clarus]